MRAFCGVSCGGEIVSAVGTGECVPEKVVSDVAFNTVRDDIGNLRVLVVGPGIYPFGVWRRPSRRTAVAKPNHKSALIESSIGISATAIVTSDNRLLQKSFSIRIALRMLPGSSATSAVPHINELAADGAYRHIHKHTSKLAIAGPVNCTPNHDLLGTQLDAN
jgi:hypothetical protein